MLQKKKEVCSFSEVWLWNSIYKQKIQSYLCIIKVTNNTLDSVQIVKKQLGYKAGFNTACF